MKKLFLLGLLAVSTEAVHAQSIAAGTVALGGNIGYSKNTNEISGVNSFTGKAYTIETTSSEFRFTPSIGFFVADNLAVGVSVGYSSTRRPYSTYTPAPSIVQAELDPATTLQLGPYVQYYHMLSEQFGVLGTLSGGYQSTKFYNYSNSGIQITETKGSGLYAGLTPGIVFFPIPKLGLSASIGNLGYNKLSYDYPTNSGTEPADYENKSSSFGANFGLSQLQFGGTFYLGR